MQNAIKIQDDLYWVGASDRRLALFENAIPIPNGISYNAYLLTDEKTVLFDTVDKAVSTQFFENLKFALAGRDLDFLVINHLEPDHSATLDEAVSFYPNVKIVCNTKTVAMIKQFFDFDIDSRAIIVKEGDTFDCGKHKLTFLMAPMVHWPEVMVTYDTTDKILFSADAFGTFGAINGNLFADELNFEHELLGEARRYYTNIVGKYDIQVQSLLKKMDTLEISLLCPLHGPVWRSGMGQYIDKYRKWSTNTPEDNTVMIVYGSIYGNTENAVNILASELAKRGIRNIRMYDASSTHPSTIVSEAFRCSHLVFASATYNAGIFSSMESALLAFTAHNIKNRTIALIENGSWAITSGKLMRDMLSKTQNTILENTISIKSSVKECNRAELESLAEVLVDSVEQEAKNTGVKNNSKVNNNALYKLSYGLFVLSAKNTLKDNACIINTVMQITNSPNQIAFAVNKQNYTHDIILNSGLANISVLTTDTPFSIFERFGFCSGQDTDKFADFKEFSRSENGLTYLSNYTNAYFALRVVSTTDHGTHTMFVAEIEQAEILSDKQSVTYEYYFEHIKPKPQKKSEKQGFVCKICGYVYEGDVLPDDYICPICKHGAEDFEPLS